MEIGQQPMMQLQESKKLKQSSVLTILVSLKEISFYFNNSHNKSVIDSKLVSIEENNDISSLLDLLKKTLSEFDLSNVLKVKLILNNKLSTLVPNELYDEKLNKDYLKYNCDLIDNDTTAVDEIIELDIKWWPTFSSCRLGNIRIYGTFNELIPCPALTLRSSWLA